MKTASDPKTDESSVDPKEEKAKVISMADATKKVETARKTLSTLKANKKENGDPAGTKARSIKSAKSRLKNAESELHQVRKDAGDLFYQRHAKPLIGGASLIVIGGLTIIAFTIFGSDSDEGESDGTDTV